jgi:hypothetical protein
MQRSILAIGLNLALMAAGFAQDCTQPPSVLIHSCQTEIAVHLRVLPDNKQRDSNHLLTVTGTYSSGDRFGIEGLVIQAGKTVSRRYQNWDGVLIIDQNGAPHLYNAKNVVLDGDEFDLKDKPRRDTFIAKAKESGATVLQSHLLISGGMLDLKDVEDAPSFKRRLLVTFRDGSFAIWETARSETLYDAARQVQDALSPHMALNLDMGAYDYCRTGPTGAESDCGGLLVSADKLTNLLEFTKD